MDWPDKGGHKGRPYHAVRGCRIVRAALVLWPPYMDWPDKGGHKGRPYHAVRGCRIVPPYPAE